MTADVDPSTWLDRYGDALYRYALLRVRNPETAADLVQDTLLAALQARGRFEHRASEKTWLTAILKNRIVDYLRRAGREVPLADDFDRDGGSDDHFDERGRWRSAPEEWPSPEKALEQGQLLQTLIDCIAHLPERMAQLFVLREVDGMSVEDLCKELNLSTTNNVWVSLSRTRMRLRDCLQRNWFDQRGAVR